ncbi:hypothetical protein CN217_19435 [Sinorhizobium meliloti]|uniref:ThiF family adenylyltransferase n=1 Tax=Rhizobium meliloti TaxID=382 RepID=UPI000FD1FB16|nr:ThiF family adenylyltransferase [Sinorhizobium meliloti]RVH08711.1 hypothetical protein CN217_19435 [Sinorhizobium meliloti]
MADETRRSNSQLRTRHRQALLEVEDWLYANCSDVTSLKREDVGRIREGMVGGWRLKLETVSGTRVVDVMVPASFPFQPARLRLVDLPEDEDWPHVEKDNVLCLVSETATFDPDDPAGGVITLLNMVIDLADLVASGRADDEFRREVLSYWGHRVPGGRKSILSLVDPAPASRLVSVWDGPVRQVIADNPDDLLKWLRNRHLGGRKLRVGIGALVWLGEPLTPGRFPKTAAGILELAKSVDAQDVLVKAAASTAGDLTVALGMETDNGVAIAGLTVPRPCAVRGRDPIHDGFRLGRTPPWLVARRFFGSEAILRADLKRADHSWIHGRDQDSRAGGIRDKTVVIFGCGSIGGPVAVALAQAGVSKFVLVDPDVLNPSNLGRHPLGAQYLGLYKSESLAAKLRQELPHVSARAVVGRIEDVLLTAKDLAEADLIVSAVGDWGAEVMLDAWSEANGRPVPIVYGWTEAHACAGHAVAVMKAGRCFRDGFDATGLPHLRVAEFPHSTVRYEPACGAVYQPYGPIELQGTLAVIGELALDVMLQPPSQSIHRLWIGRERHLRQMGGQWSPAWSILMGSRTEGGFLHDRPWASTLGDRSLAA